MSRNQQTCFHGHAPLGGSTNELGVSDRSSAPSCCFTGDRSFGHKATGCKAMRRVFCSSAPASLAKVAETFELQNKQTIPYLAYNANLQTICTAHLPEYAGSQRTVANVAIFGDVARSIACNGYLHPAGPRPSTEIDPKPIRASRLSHEDRKLFLPLRRQSVWLNQYLLRKTGSKRYCCCRKRVMLL